MIDVEDVGIVAGMVLAPSLVATVLVVGAIDWWERWQRRRR